MKFEKQKEKDVSREYDIFHMEKYEMQKFGITLPNKDDVEYGDNWRPQYDYMLFKKNIDISYNCERQK